MSHHAPEDGQPPTMTEASADTSAETQPNVHPAADDPHALLTVNRVQKYFPIKQGILFQRQVGAVKAVDGVSFSLRAG
jgi:ABC-type microcin C transport system duplicated ATPase subunit YejF